MKTFKSFINESVEENDIEYITMEYTVNGRTGGVIYSAVLDEFVDNEFEWLLRFGEVFDSGVNVRPKSFDALIKQLNKAAAAIKLNVKFRLATDEEAEQYEDHADEKRWCINSMPLETVG